jgi:ribosomal protein S18 acetylase RimI-like enzyme
MRYRIGTHKDFSDIEDCIASTEYYAPVDASTMDGTFVVAATDDGQVVGCVWVMHYGRNAYVDYLAVRPKYQHKGVAVKILAKLRHVLNRRGVRYVRSCVHLANLEAVRISKAFGSIVHSPYALCFVDLGASK